MKYLFFSICLILNSFLSLSQKNLTLPKDTFRILNRNFYVTEVINKKKNKKYIRELWMETFRECVGKINTNISESSVKNTDSSEDVTEIFFSKKNQISDSGKYMDKPKDLRPT